MRTSVDPPADGERLSYALDALIENAIKFTGNGGAIAIRARHVGDAVMIEIRDNGPGIAPAYVSRIFERFARADGSGGGGGTGLGLPIVKAIVEAHGGTITVDSSLGHGTTFRIALPGFSPRPADARASWARDAPVRV